MIVPRTRSNVTQGEPQPCIQNFTWLLGKYTSYQIVTGPLPGYSKAETMNDGIDTEYHYKKTHGLVLPVINMTKDKTSIMYSPGSVSQIYDSRHTNIYRYASIEGRSASFKSFVFTPPLPAADLNRLNSMRTIVITKSFEKVDSAQAAVLSTLGELRETREMLVSAAKNSIKVLGSVAKYGETLERLWRRRGDLKKLSNLKKLYLSAENAWMSVRFGWRPFFYDVKALHTACTAVKKFNTRQTFRAGDSLSVYIPDVKTVEYDRAYHTRVALSTRSTVFSAGVLCERRYNGFPDTFGLTKIPETIYDLTKLSWALDYFFNVGSVIAAYTPDTLWKPVASWCTDRTREETTNTFSTDQVAPYLSATYSGSSGGGYYQKTVDKVSRTKTSKSDIGIVFAPNFSWQKYTDIAIVARQLISGSFRKARLYDRLIRRP